MLGPKGLGGEALIGLHPARLAQDFLTLEGADYLSAFGLGLMGAGVVALILGPILARPKPKHGMRAQMRQAQNLPADQRQIVLLDLLRQKGRSLDQEARLLLYKGQLSNDALERMLTTRSSKARG